MLKCWETYFEKYLNTNWPRSEEAFDNIPGLVGPPFSVEEVQKVVKAVKSRKDNIPGLVGPPFSVEEVQKVVKAVKSRKDNIPGLVGPPFSVEEVQKAVKAVKSRKDNIPGLVGPPFSVEEVQKAVKAMKSRKAPGSDRIMAKALKAGGRRWLRCSWKYTVQYGIKKSDV